MPHRLSTPTAINVKALDERRDMLLAALDRFRSASDSLPPLAEKAHRLMLSRYWAKANWRRRAQILATSEWLIKLAEMSGDITTSGLL